MVFGNIGKFFRKKDPLSTRGLEEFTGPEQERILNRIATKESELRNRRAEDVAESRIRALEKKSGIRGPSIAGAKGTLKSFREHRLRNLARRAERQKKFEDNEKAFREGKLAVKPVGHQSNIKRMTPQEAINKSKLNIQPVKLKAPNNLLR